MKSNPAAEGGGLPPATLWTDGARERFFIVPDDVVLAQGTMELRTPAGRTVRIDECSAMPFEVTREQAQRWLLSHLDAAVATIGAAMAQGAARLNEAAEQKRQENEERIRAAGANWTELRDALKQAVSGLGDEWRKTRERAEAESPEAARDPAHLLDQFANRMGELADEYRAKADAARRPAPDDGDSTTRG